MDNNKFYKLTFICMLVFTLVFTGFMVKIYNNLLFLLVYPVAIISIIVNKLLEVKVFSKKQIGENWEELIELVIYSVPIGIVLYAIDFGELTLPYC